MIKKIVGMIVLSLFLISCAGTGIQLKDRETGAEINTLEDKFCFDDGRRFAGCVERPNVEKETPDEPSK